MIELFLSCYFVLKYTNFFQKKLLMKNFLHIFWVKSFLHNKTILEWNILLSPHRIVAPSPHRSLAPPFPPLFPLLFSLDIIKIVLPLFNWVQRESLIFFDSPSPLIIINQINFFINSSNPIKKNYFNFP